MSNSDQGDPLPVLSFYQTDLALLHGQLQRHPVAQAYLSGQNIRFDGAALTQTDRIELPAPTGSVSTLGLAHLFSVFNGSRVHQQCKIRTGLTTRRQGCTLRVINRRILQYKNRTGIFKEHTHPELFIQGLHIDHFFLRKERSRARLATIAIALCAITAHLTKFGTISLVAAGGRAYNKRHVGYKVWPKLGFDANLLPGETSSDPRLQQCQTVQDILAIDAEWWRVNGSQRLMTFDLSPNSASWRKLLLYVHEKLLSDGEPT